MCFIIIIIRSGRQNGPEKKDEIHVRLQSLGFCRNQKVSTGETISTVGCLPAWTTTENGNPCVALLWSQESLPVSDTSASRVGDPLAAHSDARGSSAAGAPRGTITKTPLIFSHSIFTETYFDKLI